MAEGYTNRSYRLQEMDERCYSRGGGVGGVSIHFGLGDSLARSGRLREAIGVYAYCCRRIGASSVPLDRLRHLSTALLESIAGGVGKRGASPTRQTSPPHRSSRAGAQGGQMGAGGASNPPLPVPACFACPVCEGVLYQPVTASCGHTFCKKCLINEGGKPCIRCGHRLNAGGLLVTNVLIKSLVEKWWGPELRAVQMRDEGNELFHRNQVEAALQKYDEAVRFAPNNHLLLSNRSHALYRLNRHQEALADADTVVRLKPSWGKGHYRRGVALFSLGQYEDALTAFCTCVALDGNAHAVRHEVSQVLLRILVPSGLSSRSNHMSSSPQSSSPTNHHRLSPTLYSLCYSHSYSPPYPLNSPMRRGVSQRYHTNVFNHSSCPPSPPHPLIPSVEVSPPSPTSRSLPNSIISQSPSPIPQLSLASLNQLGLHSSDCEDNSSGEEDSVHSQSYCRSSLSSENARLQGILDRLLREMEKIKRGDHKLTGNGSSPPSLSPPSIAFVDPVDFDCVLCCRTLWSPVTTPCGHTYCWVCLDRCLDYSCACPLCMASLTDYLATSPRSITEFIEQALWTYLPAEYETRHLIHKQELSEGGTGSCVGGILGPEGVRVEPRVPVFVCTAAFPHVPCPLFVYEPRYRLMVRRCVETGGRQFAIAACVSSSRRSDGLSRYADYGTMLEMRDWVLMGDGCSILSTVGIRRFRVIARGERDGYDTAQVQFIQDQPISPEQVNGVKQLHDRVRRKSQLWLSTVGHSIRLEIERTFGVMPELESDDSWLSMPDGPAWTWWVLAILPLGQNLQVGILATTSLEKRLRAIDKTLDHMQRQVSASSTSASSSQDAPGVSSSTQSLETTSSQQLNEQENSARSATEERRSSFDSES